MFTGYLKYSGIEIANSSRFYSYLANGLGQGVVPHEDCRCDTLVFDDPGPYTLPNQDCSPWWDAARPESAHFAGMWVQNIIGLDSPYAPRDISEAPIGGALGALRLGPREVVVTATLWGLSTFGLDYGLGWLTAVLAGKHCESDSHCNLGDLEFFAACPEADQGSNCGNVPVVDETCLDLRRTMFSGGLVNGPQVIDRHVMGRKVVAYNVRFSLAMESPYLAGEASQALPAALLTEHSAVAAEQWECPVYVDPCPTPEVETTQITLAASCATFIENTCDFNDAYATGPSSWATQTWQPTTEGLTGTEGECGAFTITRTGNTATEGCARSAIRASFGDALGRTGPLSIEFDYTTGSGNLYFHLWNPATDENIPIGTATKPTGASAGVSVAPTGDILRIRNDSSDIGHYKINYELPSGVDPGNLYLIVNAFGGGAVDGTDPEAETIENLKMNFAAVTIEIPGDPVPTDCCTLEPGAPIVDPTFSVPCWTDPASTHRQVAAVTNESLFLDAGARLTITNTDTTAITGVRVAVYDPSRIGLDASSTATHPSVTGVWPGGVENWECVALVGDMFIPEIPAESTLEINGYSRKTFLHHNNDPAAATWGDRYVYGGAFHAWNYRTIPPCSTYVFVVFTDSDGNGTSGTVLIESAGLHLVAGAAQ